MKGIHYDPLQSWLVPSVSFLSGTPSISVEAQELSLLPLDLAAPFQTNSSTM